MKKSEHKMHCGSCSIGFSHCKSVYFVKTLFKFPSKLDVIS